jgi:hypothetical protein
VIKVFGRIIFAAVSGGLLSGFSVGGIGISHLLFGNDSLIFCWVDLDHLRHLQYLFLCFEAILGLEINLAKLKLVPIGNVANVDGLADILGCGDSSLALKYFGLLLGASVKAKHILDDVIEKIKCCLANWLIGK